MATEIPAEGYLDLRNYVEANWTHLSLRDGSDVEILRLPLSDERISWNHSAGANPLELLIELQADDEDIEPLLPVTIAGTKLFKAAEGGDSMSGDTFAHATLASSDPADTATLRHRIQLPQIQE